MKLIKTTYGNYVDIEKMECFYVWVDPGDYAVSVLCNNGNNLDDVGESICDYSLYRIDCADEKAQADAIEECKEWLESFINKIGATVIDNESHFKNRCEIN
ncbi:hypothetical protein [Ruminococcus sp.]|uniref:hypothetical protein n=1 Tax=Ruminococcus sp. TaxID=41978 RepID=UPI001B3F2F14|nr:hypothetical protein [Ruminococcus sp.]MBP5432320.1 hypothetical protein [Ruminococcus sp.]